MSRHPQRPQVREAVFAHIELVNGCHHFAALEPRGKWISSCVADAFGIELLTYAHNYADIIGKRAQFIFEDGILTEIRSVEGYTADQILAAKLRQTLRLSPFDPLPAPSESSVFQIGYGAHKRWHDCFRQRHKRGKLALASDGHITYLVQDLGVIELATPIWLGQLPLDTSGLCTDDMILAFEQRCHDYGNIARRTMPAPWEIPVLDTRPRFKASPPLTL